MENKISNKIERRGTAEEFLESYPLSPEQLGQMFDAKKEREAAPAELSEEAKEKLRAYWDKVLSLPEKPIEYVPTRSFDLTMDYENEDRSKSAKHLVYNIFKEQEKRTRLKGNWEFEVKFQFANYSETLRSLIRYFINDKTGPLQVDKWVYVWGEVGCGKTHLMDIMRHFCIDHNNGKMFVMNDTPSIPATIKATPDTINLMTCYDMLFDDAGYKIAPVLYANENINPLEFILWKRYGKWQASRQLTYFTSNLPFDTFLSRFDERLQDRIRSCTSVIQLKGKSLRNSPIQNQ